MKNKYDKSVSQMNKDFAVITNVYKKLNSNKEVKSQIVPASEWLLDNFYIVEEHAKQIKRDFNKKLYSDLPLSGNGYTRIFTIAREIVLQNDGKIDENIIESFINKYQEVSPLYMREIWSLGVCLRIALIEKIRKISEEIYTTCTEWEKADKWLSDYNGSADLKLPDTENYSFFEHISYKLRRMSKNGIVLLNRIDSYIEKYGTTIELISRKEHSIQAAMKIAIGNSIQSLKYISNINWDEVFNNVSEIEHLFDNEKSGIYKRMDLVSKNLYRGRVEKIAASLEISELHVAKKCVECADENFDDEKWGHVGYYLIGSGEDELENRLDVKKPVGYKIRKLLKKEPFPAYFMVMILFAIASTWLFSWFISSYYGAHSINYLGFTIFAIIAFDGGVCFANYIFSRIFKPRIIPRLDFSKEVPDTSATMVIVPTLLSSTDRVKNMLNNLEKYFIGASDENIFFTLIGDVKESEKEVLPEDDKIAEEGIRKVLELNNKYGRKKFFFVYRKRFFNASEGKWLGWERKRGAILKFNEFLKTKKAEEYKCVSSGFDELPEIKYILTLDADTFVPIGEAKKLIGAIAHPVNKPVLNDEENVVIEGHGIIQPHIGIDVISSNQSKFSRIFAGAGGIDPYVCASSDIYQDLFGEAIFTGKGIFDLDVFQKVLKDTVPDNSVLSHDLLEGSYLRAGLATDIELIDGYPSRYNAYAMRAHRWTRGDWQILPWLFGRVKNRNNEKVRNPINGISKWKIFDNLRRTLTAPLIMLLIFLSFSLLPGEPLFWTAFALILGIRGNRRQFLYQVLFLPFQAWLMTSAIFVTLYRLLFARRNLLEWVTAADMETKLKNTCSSFYLLMKSGILQGVLVVLLAYFFKPTLLSLGTAAFLFVLWATSPKIAYEISKPTKIKKEALNKEDIEELRGFARNIWAYFDELMNEENNFLPPDNFQEDPPNGIANRTSPTNIGLSMLSIISAYDLGFIDLEDLLRRMELLLQTVEKLEKWNGHLINWYNTKTLKALFPRYISTVDSGNFLAYLITAREGLKQIDDEKNKEKREKIVQKLDFLINEMDFSILYDKKKNIFSIGYNLEEGRLTNSYYDLLASESRQTSFLAVARHEVPIKHWFALGRNLTKLNGEKGLVSWTGTMFEYLMPLLVMKNYPKTLLDETYNFVLKSQIEYAKKKGVVWGISESAFYNFDINLNYQYKALGVPWLGLKRGLIEDTVISPYSTMLALMINAKEALKNLRQIKSYDMFGKYGFYEAIDFTSGRLKFASGDRDFAQVKTYMAHHQGMSLVSINNVINNFIMQERFHSDVYVKTAETLLQEKIPGDSIYTKDSKEKVVKNKKIIYANVDTDRLIEIKENTIPSFHVLTNGSYFLRINDRGVGVSNYKNISLSRFRNDYIETCYGELFYIRILNSNKIFSGAYEPFITKPDKYFAVFSGDKAKFVRRDGSIEVVQEVIVAAEDNAEIRKITITNDGNEDLDFEITGYLEIIAGDQRADIAHRNFYSLFLTTEIQDEILLAHRKKRTKDDAECVIYQTCFAEGEVFGDFQFETDRVKFLGRGKSHRNSITIEQGKPLMGNVGAVLDPIFAERRLIHIKHGAKGEFFMITGVETNREQAISTAKKYSSVEATKRAMRLAFARNQVEMSYLNLTSDEIKTFDEMIKYLV